MNKNQKRFRAANPGKWQPRKSTHPKVGASAQNIMRRLYPPDGIRPEFAAYKFSRGIA